MRKILLLALILLMSTPALANAACTTLTRDLAFGDFGSDVTYLQEFLTTNGFLSSGNTTGYFGAVTQSAVQNFQAQYGIVSSGDPETTGWGVVGAKTREVINSMCVTSSPPPPPPSPSAPTISFSANPSSITSGQSSTLSWSSTNATSCNASNGWSGSKALTGSQVVTPTVTTTYTLTCSGSGGSIAQSVTVSVGSSAPPPPPPPSSNTLQLGGGTFAQTPGYGFSNAGTALQVIPAASSRDAAAIFQKTSNYGGGGGINSTVFVFLKKTASNAGAYGTALFSEAVDAVGGLSTFIEGGRIGALLSAQSVNGSAYGLVTSAIAGESATKPVSFGVVVGIESEVDQWTADAPAPGAFNKDHFVTSYLATNGLGANGAKKSDAGFMTNMYSAAPYRTGFLVPENSVDYAAFASRAASVIGLDLSVGKPTFAAIALPNNSPIRGINGTNTGSSNLFMIDPSSNLVLGLESTNTLIQPGTGNVGIGLFNPSSKLDVKGTVTAERLCLKKSNGTTVCITGDQLGALLGQ